MPLLKEENPSLAENLSATALRLRQDEAALDALAKPTTDVNRLRQLEPAIQSRVLAKLLVDFGVNEPEAEHVGLLRKLVYSDVPSAMGHFPGVVIVRQYDRLVKLRTQPTPGSVKLKNPGITEVPEWGLRVICTALDQSSDGCRVRVQGELSLRSRQEGDTVKLPGGTKTLKKLLIDRKIPAHERDRIPVLADEAGVVAVVGIGPNGERLQDANTTIYIEIM
jgi:tRNA(Ile)-lysidine synthase